MKSLLARVPAWDKFARAMNLTASAGEATGTNNSPRTVVQGLAFAALAVSTLFCLFHIATDPWTSSDQLLITSFAHKQSHADWFRADSLLATDEITRFYTPLW